MSSTPHAFEKVVRQLETGGQTHRYFSLPALDDPRVEKLPHSIRVLLESAVRNCDGFAVTDQDVELILDWEKQSPKGVEVQYKPARVMLQDFTGVPAVVDLAAMREATKLLGGDPEKINPLVNVHAVVDHSLQVDVSASPEAAETNARIEFERNHERFKFLKWGQSSFRNMTVTPPSNAIVHQLNLEYACRSVCRDEDTNTVYLDSTVGTDSHTTMSAGLGVLSWGVGGLEAEAVMLGQAISLVLPEVIGYKITGDLPTGSTATDLVLTVVNELRKVGVVGKFVEFFGPGVAALSLADRATISNMSPETGATTVFFPPDEVAMAYLRQTGRDEAHVKMVEDYLRAQGMFRDYAGADPVFTRVLELDLSTIVPCVSGPKRPHDRVALKDMKSDFAACLANPVGFKGFAIEEAARSRSTEIEVKGKKCTLTHGSVVIAAITSCTNTSNPDVMLAAGLLAKRAVEAGIAGAISPACKTSLAPGSRVVIRYLKESGLLPYLEQLGFHIVGVGCAVCIGNSGPLSDPAVEQAIEDNDLVVAGVLSGNRNFEGRVSPYTRANYLASPPLVVAYALAGRADIDFATEPIATSATTGKPVFLKDIWPGRDECNTLTNTVVKPALFREVYSNISEGNERWNALEVAKGSLYDWDPESTYIHLPPYFEGMTKEPLVASNGSNAIRGARALLNLGDSITTDHISPAGAISRTSPAARYLKSRGVDTKDFNSYGSRRGNDEVMVRGTYANIRIVNKLVGKAGPRTVHVPTGEEGDIYDVAMRYKEENTPVIVLAGKDLGSGSSRDWAAKGPKLQGVRACIATSYERIHRSNLIGMAIIPLQFQDGQDADSLGLTGREVFDVEIPDELVPGQDVKVSTDTGVTFTTKLRIDTPSEKAFVEHGGILQYVIRQILKQN